MDIKADPKARDERVNKHNIRTTAMLVIDGEVVRGFGLNRKKVEGY